MTNIRGLQRNIRWVPGQAGREQGAGTDGEEISRRGPRARPGGEQRPAGSEYQGRVPGPGRVEYRARQRVNVKEGGPGQAGRRAESDGERRRQT